MRTSRPRVWAIPLEEEPMTALRTFDPEIAPLVQAEEAYQKDTLRLLASQNCGLDH